MVLLFPLILLTVLIAPVILLVRVSVFCYLSLNLDEWLSIAIGIVVAFGSMVLFISWLYRKWTSRKKLKPNVRSRNLKFSAAVLGFYCLYGLFYIAGVNVKSAEIRAQYTQLHPILRIGVGSLLLFDRSAVITDLARTHADYETMNLEKKKKSLHYLQSDGYVHAADLRTNNRAGWKNTLMKIYFSLLGFNTLRHIGTADHLHISLTAKDNLRGI